MTINQSQSQSPIPIPINIAIIGAGLTGLITADLLEQAFKRQNRPITITIFEKSAGVGRLATRYQTPPTDAISTKHWQFDFGAQYFTAKTAAFQAYLQPWLDSGIIEPWQAVVAVLDSDAIVDKAVQPTITAQWGSAQHEQPRYISSPKMTTWGRAIAKKLTHSTIHYKTRVSPLADNTVVNASKTPLVDIEGNQLGEFDWVICTAPQAQAIDLLANSDFAQQDALKTPTMLACYTLMLGWKSLSAMPQRLHDAKWSVLECKVADNADHSSHVNSRISCLGKVFIEHHKPNRDHLLPSITIYADNDWSQAHVDDDIREVQDQLLDAVQHLVQWDDSSAPAHIDCHRWRYAATKANHATGRQLAYVDSKKHWIVTGDWCDAGRIESGYKAASHVVQLLVEA